MRKSFNGVGVVVKTAFCSLFFPFCTVAVAVEDNLLVVLYCLLYKGSESLGEVLCLFKLVCKLTKFFCNNGVENNVCVGYGLA